MVLLINYSVLNRMSRKSLKNHMDLLRQASEAGVTLNKYRKMKASGSLPVPSPLPVPSQGTWECPRCTFENPASNNKCSMCDYQKVTNPVTSVRSSSRKVNNMNNLARRFAGASVLGSSVGPSPSPPPRASGGPSLVGPSLVGPSLGGPSLGGPSLGASNPIVGLQNPNGKGDNKCYINATLQLLYAIPELHEELSKITSDAINHLRPAKQRNPNTGEISNRNVFGACGPIEKDQIRALKSILEGMRSNKILDTETVMINGKSAYQLLLEFSPDFVYHRQADASTLVNSILQLFNPYVNCQGFEDLSRKIFIDKTKNSVKLRSDPSRFVPLRDNEELPILQLQITNPRKKTSIEDLLQDYERPGNIEESSGRLNRFPGNLMIQDKKTIKLHDEQRVLIIQIKRFAYNEATGQISKLKSGVIPNERIRIDNKDFILEGCIIHDGGYGGGHYVYLTFINGKPNNVINDETISSNKYYIDKLHTDGYIYLYKRIPNINHEIRVAVTEESNLEMAIAASLKKTPSTPATVSTSARSTRSTTLRNSKINSLVSMGFNKNKATKALLNSNGNVGVAITKLTGGRRRTLKKRS